MSRTVLLDSGVLGLATNPKPTVEALRCARWLDAILAAGAVVVVPEIADYEVRRELLRAGRTNGIRRLDALKSHLFYLPITTDMMLKAAEFWAQARRQGKPTAAEGALDGDAILAAQAAVLSAASDQVAVIATTNVGHLSRFVAADVWDTIQPD